MRFPSLRVRLVTIRTAALGAALLLLGGCRDVVLPTATDGEAYFRISIPPQSAAGVVLRITPVGAALEAAGGGGGATAFSVEELSPGYFRVLAAGALPPRFEVRLSWVPGTGAAAATVTPMQLLGLNGAILPPVGVLAVAIDPPLASPSAGRP